MLDKIRGKKPRIATACQVSEMEARVMGAEPPILRQLAESQFWLKEGALSYFIFNKSKSG